MQLGDPKTDHECWHRPEDVLQGARRGYKVDASRPGSDVAGETAAALAAASIAFAKTDPGYSNTLLSRAKKVRPKLALLTSSTPNSLTYTK